MEVEYLGLDDLLVIGSAVLGIEAEVLAKATDLGTADSAINAPAASFGGHEFYPDFPTKLGVLGYRLCRIQAFPDGNKRIAFLAMIEFAERNGQSWAPLSDDDAVDTIVAAAAGDMTQDAFVRWASERLG